MTTSETSLNQSSDRDGHLRTDDLMDNLGQRTARGGFITIISQGSKFVLSMVGTVILSRLLVPEEYGLVGMVAVVTGFISVFKDLGLSAATIQKSEVNNDQVSTLFWLNLCLSVGLTIVTAALAPAVAWFYGEPKLTAITLAYAAGFLFGGLTVQHEALLRRRMRFAALATAEVVSLVISILVAVTLAWKGASYWALVASQLALGFTYLIVIWSACRWRPGLPVRNSGVRSMLAFGGRLTGFGVVNYFSRNLDNMLIGKFWGAEQLGLYARAYQLLLLPIDQINTPITSVAVPALSRLKDSPERYRSAYLRLLEKVALLTMPTMAFMIASSEYLITIVLGSKWLGVSRIFAILGIAGLVQPIANTTGWLFITQGRTADMFKWGMIGGGIIIIAIISGLHWGAIGVATSYSIANVILIVPLLLWYVTRKGPVRMIDFYATLAPIAIAAIGSLAIVLTIKRLFPVENSFVGLALNLSTTIVTTLVIMALLPRGRRALNDLKESMLVIFRKTSSAA